MTRSKNEYAMELLAGMTFKVIAKKLNIEPIVVFDLLMNSRTGSLLFDDSYLFWQNGPDCIANEYFLENSGK